METIDQLRPARGLLNREPQQVSLSEKCDLIEATIWGKHFSYEQVKQLAAYTAVYAVTAGSVIFSEGDRESYLVLVTRGQVDVIKSDADSTPKKIYTVGPGKTIGEMNLIDGEPRSASAIAATDARLLVMTAKSFAALNEELPGVGLVLVMRIARQMSQYLRLTSGKLIDYLGS